MTTKFYVNANGSYIGGFAGVLPPAGSIEVPTPPDDARQMWTGDAWVAPPIDLTAYASHKRWEKETGGIDFNGQTIDTSRESQSMITGAYNYSQANSSETIQFKAASGWVPLDVPTLAAIATAVGEHVQACFALEASVSSQIADGTITTTAEIDAWFANDA